MKGNYLYEEKERDELKDFLYNKYGDKFFKKAKEEIELLFLEEYPNIIKRIIMRIYTFPNLSTTRYKLGIKLFNEWVEEELGGEGK